MTHNAKMQFCVITLEPFKTYTQVVSQNDFVNLSFVKDEHTYGSKMTKNGPKMATLFQFCFE